MRRVSLLFLLSSGCSKLRVFLGVLCVIERGEICFFFRDDKIHQAKLCLFLVAQLGRKMKRYENMAWHRCRWKFFPILFIFSGFFSLPLFPSYWSSQTQTILSFDVCAPLGSRDELGNAEANIENIAQLNGKFNNNPVFFVFVQIEKSQKDDA